MNDTTPRKTAKALGLKKYEGRACLHGHGTTRAVASGVCVTCRNASKAKARVQKRILQGTVKLGRKRKYPIFVGPPKPKTNTPKYDRTTEFGDWVWRSKNGGKRVERATLTVPDYESIKVTHCPLLGLELSYANCKRERTPDNYASLDKIDPTKGYVMGNVQIVSFRANTLKNSATLEELKMIVQNWEKQSA